MGIETELKLTAPAGLRVEELALALADLATVSTPVVVETRDVYLDTRSRRLAQAGLSARWRRRRGEPTGAIEIKVVPLAPEVVLRREEVRAPLRRGEDPARALRALARRALGLRLGGALHAEVEVRAIRTVVTLEGPDACVAELSLDEVTARRPRGRRSASFAEVELELKRGEREGFDLLAQALAALPGLEPSVRSKHRRSLELLGAAGPGATPEAPRFGPLTPADEVARLLCAHQLRVLEGHELGSRVGLDPEQVHKMRVATRRLRAMLRALADSFDARRCRRVLDELRWLAGRLGAVRDLDVQLLGLEQRQRALGPEPRAGWDLLRRTLEDRQARARRELVAALDSPRYTRLLERARLLFEAQAPRRRGAHPGASPIVDVAAAIVERRARQLGRQVRAVRRDPTAPALHETRIRGKKLRYAGEFFGSLFGESFAEGIERLRAFQDALGAFQDDVVLGALAESLRDEALRATTPDPGYLAVLGALAAAGRLGARGVDGRLASALADLGGPRALRALARHARQCADEVHEMEVKLAPVPA